MISFRRPFLAALVAAVALWSRPASAGTVELIGLGWMASEIRYRIEPGVAASVVTDIQSAVNDWNAALSAVPGAPQLVEASPGRDTASLTIRVGGDGGRTLGSTSLHSQSDCIVDSVTVDIHDQTGGGNFTSAGMRTLIRHELGHVVGLGHSDDPNDLMFESGNPRSTTERLIRGCHTLGLMAIYPFQGGCGAVPQTIRCQFSQTPQ